MPLNLLENAAKYGVKGYGDHLQGGVLSVAELTVHSSTRRGRKGVDVITLQVAFFRSDLVQKGAGLGLWLCNEIIRLHNGRIEVTSGHHRFEITVNLPLAEVVVDQVIA